MQVYDKKNKDYIKNLKIGTIGNSKSLEVIYSDGQKFYYPYSKEAYKNLNNVMEVQASEAASKKNQYYIRELFSVIFGTGAVSLSSYGTVFYTDDFTDYKKLMACAGASLIGITIGTLGFVKNHKKRKELNKLQYRNNNIEMLSHLKNYRHALEGLSQETKEKITQTPIFFSVANTDNYTEKDLRKIIANINREEFLNEKVGQSPIKPPTKKQNNPSNQNYNNKDEIFDTTEENAKSGNCSDTFSKSPYQKHK